MAELSPAAQAVLDAFCASEDGVYLEGDPERIAAALRAVADQARENRYITGRWLSEGEILTIAYQLEHHND